MSVRISPADIEAAHARIVRFVRETPVIAADAEMTGAQGADVVLKLESLQCTGSFKARGAFNALLAAPPGDAGVVAASGGNHGAAVAYAARTLGVRAEIFVPETAPAIKVERLRAYGAEVRQTGRVYAEAFAHAEARAAETGAALVHAYDQPHVVAGQGTLAREFERQADGLDTVLVAVGGGGLIGGALAWLGERVRVVAVESAGTPTLKRALEAGASTPIEVGGLAADSLGASRIGAIGFALAQERLHDALLVEDEEIRAAQRRLWDAMRVIAEPGGAAAFAALLVGRYKPRAGERVGVIVCGGNADLSFLR